MIMIDDNISRALMPFSVDQLERILTTAKALAEQKREAKKNASRFPPVASDLDSLASMQDLDLSGLMREISRR